MSFHPEKNFLTNFAENLEMASLIFQVIPKILLPTHPDSGVRQCPNFQSWNM